MSITRLQQARDRLDKAVSRLEAASRKRLANDPDGESALASELDAVRERCVTLEKRSRAVSERLDATINRVREILGE